MLLLPAGRWGCSRGCAQTLGPTDYILDDPGQCWVEGQLWRIKVWCSAYTGVFWMWTSPPLSEAFPLSVPFNSLLRQCKSLNLSAFFVNKSNAPHLSWCSRRTTPSSNLRMTTWCAHLFTEMWPSWRICSVRKVPETAFPHRITSRGGFLGSWPGWCAGGSEAFAHPVLELTL